MYQLLKTVLFHVQRSYPSHFFPFLLSFPIITSYLRSSSFPLQNILRFNIFYNRQKKNPTFIHPYQVLFD
jgi:hypothetical protein